MLNNYFKTSWRGLFTNKLLSFINVAGLSVGMGVAILIGLWIWDELSFNKYHQHYDRIGQVMIHNGDGTYNMLPIPLATELRTAFQSDLESVVLSSDVEQHLLSTTGDRFLETGRYMQPEAPGLFTLKMLRGDRAGLRDVSSILLSRSLAKKLFGDTDPLNKVLKIDNQSTVKVTGVYEDLPENTALYGMAFIAPFDLYVATNRAARAGLEDWRDNSFNIFVEIRAVPGIAPDAQFANISAKIKDLKLSHISKEKAAEYKPEFFLNSMSKWHLYSNFENRVRVSGEALKFVWFYGIIGVFVLLLACINFMNLSTARSEKRAKEVGIRKAIGSMRGQLVRLFLSESLLITAFAFGCAILLVQLILPWFNTVAGKSIVFPWANPLFWIAGLVFCGVTGLLAGSYPAFYLSSFKPVRVLKGSWRAGRFAAVPRKVLVVVQFTVSIALIIATLVVYGQIQYARDRPVGYSQESLLTVRMPTADFVGKNQLFRSELKRTGLVADMAESGSALTGMYSETGGISWKGKDSAMETSFGIVNVTVDYGRTIGWQFTEGRDLSKDFPSDSAGFVINEAAAKYMGLRHPVGETLDFKGAKFIILGVVRDMVMNSPFDPAYPTVFFLGKDQGDMGILLIKIDHEVSASRAIAGIRGVFKTLVPAAPFEYSFVNEDYATKFAAEERVGTLAGFFAVLAVFISCLGLFGLAAFVAEQRTREIGLRKVLGASVFTLWRLLAGDFLVLVGISLLIAGPLAYYFMHGWLQQYAYRTGIAWWIFVAAGSGALVITLLTVSYQAIRTAFMNPVRSLRAE